MNNATKNTHEDKLSYAELAFPDAAKSAVAYDKWEWMEGMKIYHPEDKMFVRLVEVVGLESGGICADAVVIERPTGGNNTRMIMPGEIWDWLPDFSDPATLGCLLHLAQEAHGQYVWVRKEGVNYTAMCGQFDHLSAGRKSVAHALIAAFREGSNHDN